MTVTIQQRGGTAAEWTSANPVLAARELGIETDTGLFKIGDGVSTWNSLTYKPLRTIDEADVVVMDDQETPAAPASGSLNLYAKSLGGRMMLRQQGPSGLATPLQPSFFQNNIVMINTNATTSVGVIGNSVTSVGTLSHPAVTEAYGYMTNFVTGGSAGNTAGTGTNGALFLRGSVAGGANGFFFNARLALPDASYEAAGATTGSRIFAGLTSGTLAAQVGSDAPAGDYCGFMRRSVNGGAQDTNWQFQTRAAAGAASTVGTGMPFAPQKVYDFYIFCAPNGTTVYWRIDNVTDGTSAEGSTTTALPTNNVYMRAGFQVLSVNAVARNIRMQRVYVESDR